jgi:hypothetical protein
MAAVHSERDESGGLQLICHKLTLVRPPPLTASRLTVRLRSSSPARSQTSAITS